MKLLITGAAGFVAGHFIEYLNEYYRNWDVLCIDKNAQINKEIQYFNIHDVSFQSIDLLDTGAVRELIRDFQPDYALHLAALSSVAASWKQPSECIMNNTVVFLNLIESIREICPNCRILSVGSSEEYGVVKGDDLPIHEKQALNPASPYAVARVSQEQLSRIYVKSYGIPIVLTRSFNHIGPRQDERFVVPGFIKKVLELRSMGKNEGIIETGNVNIIRDFVDVRDVVRAYYMLLLSGKPGEAYNVCSGKRILLKSVLNIIGEEIGVSVTARVNPKLVRPQDSPETVGTYYKMESEFGWTPTIEIQDTIHDMVLWQEKKFR